MTEKPVCPCCSQTLPVVIDWTGWIAVLFEDQEENANWCIAPKEFWEANHYVPDHCLETVPKGFFECTEHTLDSGRPLPEQEKMLREHGFEIVEWIR